MYNISGIYQIQSIKYPERIYIGSSCKIDNRFIYHKHYLKFNKHPNKKIQYHYNKYKNSDLKYSVLEYCTKEVLITREQYYIDLLSPYFNICLIAASSAGRKHTKKTKEKIGRANRIAHLGKKCSKETKRKIGNANRGKIFSKEARLNMSNARKGNKNTLGHHWKLSKETIKKMEGKRPNMQGKNHVMYGKHLSEEHKRKISKSMKQYFLNKTKY